MKKKLFLVALMLALVVCALTASVSAGLYGESDIYYFDASVEELDGKSISEALFYTHRNASDVITEYSGAFPKTNSNGEAICWYKLGQVTVGNNVFVAVKSFVTMDPAYANIPGDGRYLFKSGCGVTKNNVVSVNFPNDSGLKSFSNGSAYSLYSQTGGYHPSNSELLFAYFPNTWTKTERLVQATPVLEVYFDQGSTLDTIEDTATYDCDSLRKIVLPKTIKYIKGGAGAFYGCGKLVDINIHETIVETIGFGAFYNCDSLTKLEFPNTFKKFTGSRAMQDMDSLVEVRFGASFEGTDADMISLCYLSKNLKYVYFSSTLKYLADHNFGTEQGGMGTSDMVFFYTGDKNQLDTLYGNIAKVNQRFLNATPIEWNSNNSDQYYKNLATTEGKCYVVYSYNACEAFYNGVHVENDTVNGNACYLADCKNCDFESKYIGSNDTHNLNTKYTYENGYMAAGQIVSICQNADCKHGTEETAITSPLEALFEDLEYSVSEKGFGICVKYNVNRGALKNYKDAGNEMSFGVVAIMADKVENNGPLANDGTVAAQNNVVAADVTADNLAAVTLKIAGDENAWKNNATRAIYVLGYATNGTDLEYLGSASETQADRNNITSVKSLVIGQFFNFNA